MAWVAAPEAARAVCIEDLLAAIRRLSTVEEGRTRYPVSWRNVGAEELGSIYESLLDYTPRVTTTPDIIEGRDVPAHTFILDPRGMARKTSGSYYTHILLVSELIKSALLPVIRDRLADVIPADLLVDPKGFRKPLETV